MSSVEKNKIPRQIKQDRVTLRPEALGRINNWITQLNEEVKGIAVTRSDLVDWLVQSHPAVLSSKDVSVLKDRHFDDVAFAAWALKQLKQARSRGEQSSLSELLGRSQKPRHEKPKKKEAAEALKTDEKM